MCFSDVSGGGRRVRDGAWSCIFHRLYFQGKVIEPLKDFHKDEVRELGDTLGLPQAIVHRHPFPGEQRFKNYRFVLKYGCILFGFKKREQTGDLKQCLCFARIFFGLTTLFFFILV